jgi:hypothetical protein
MQISIDSAAQSDWIELCVPPQNRVKVTIHVVEQVTLDVHVRPFKPERELKTSKP